MFPVDVIPVSVSMLIENFPVGIFALTFTSLTFFGMNPPELKRSVRTVQHLCALSTLAEKPRLEVCMHSSQHILNSEVMQCKQQKIQLLNFRFFWLNGSQTIHQNKINIFGVL